MWKTAKEKVLWATLGALEYVERAIFEEPVLRKHEARFARIIARAVTFDRARRWYRFLINERVYESKEREATDADVLSSAERVTKDESRDGTKEAVSALLSMIIREARQTREDAINSVQARAGIGIPKEFRELAVDEAFHLVRGIPDTLREELRGLMRETIVTGQRIRTQHEFARELTKRWKEFSRERAQLIARTEWARAAGVATLGLYLYQNMEAKVWITLGDDKVCPLCAANAAAGVIPITDKFPGGVTTVPQHPRCRCSISGALLRKPGERVTGPVQATTVEEAENWARTALNIDVDYSDIKNVTIWNAVNTTLYWAFKEYPTVAQRIKFVGSASGYERALQKRGISFQRAWDNTVYASALRVRAIGYPAIVLNDQSSFFSSLSTLLRSMQRDVASRWHPPETDSVAGLILHEFGHFIEDAIYSSGVTIIVQYRELLNRLRLTAPSVVARAISKYAATSHHEIISEAFAEWKVSTKPRKAARELGEFIDQIFKR